MNICFPKWAIFVLLAPLLSSPPGLTAGDPSLLKAKQEVEARGYIFEISRDDILAKAKAEGRLRILCSLDPKAYPHLISAFKKKYPFIDVYIEEIAGADSGQRFGLELKAGRVNDWDVMHMTGEFYNEYEGHKKNFDILGMAQHGVLRIPKEMLDREKRNVVFTTSVFSIIPYNRKLIALEKVPDRWEDFLKPEFKGRKFMFEIRGGVKDLVAMIPAWGLERVLAYARNVAAQEPIWMIGYTRILAAIAGGEPLAHMVNWHSTIRAQKKDAMGTLAYKVVEPVPVRLTVADTVVKYSSRPYAALLWLEFLAGAEAQAIIDKYEPLKSNLYVPGSAVANALAGKKVSVATPEDADAVPELMQKVVAALGFPEVEKR